MESLLDFEMEVTLDGDSLSAAEIRQLLAQSEGLALIRGKWVEVDHARLSRALEQFEAIEQRAATDGLSFGEAMRMLAGVAISGDQSAEAGGVDWSETVAGAWLAETLAALRRPNGNARFDLGSLLQGTLRPYQQAGVKWLHLLTGLRLGACLADDMGLGKTIQVLSLLLLLKNEAADRLKPCLLVAPASLGRRPVSVADGDQAILQLPGLGGHVQTCCSGALWRRRQAGPEATTSLRAPRRGRK